MLNIAAQPKPEWVTLKDIELNGEKYDFRIEGRSLPTSLAIRLGSKDDLDFNLLEYLSAEDVADRITGWESEALKDLKTKKMIPCNRKTILAFIEQVESGYDILTRALMLCYVKRLRKNSKASSDTIGKTAQPSAGAVDNCKETVGK